MAVDVGVETKVDALRAQMPAVLKMGYFNTGTYGPMPRAAFEAASAVTQAEFEQGRITPGSYEASRERRANLSSLAADIFGADPDEIAITHSAGEGLNAALMGFTWERGDEVVTTMEEHPGLLLPLALLAQRHGVITRYAELPRDGRNVVEVIGSRITSRTRVIALSHVLWSTGAVLPLGTICDLAREHEVMVFVDGAQSAGQVPINLHELGIDAYAMAGQKWLCGPEATGLLFIRRDRLADIMPTYTRYGQFDVSGFYMPNPGASRFEIGEFSAASIAAQAATLRWLRDEVGLDWAYGRISTLGARFRGEIAGIPGVSVVTPAAAMAGIVNFNVEGLKPQEVVSSLFDRGYIIRYVDTKPCIVSARTSIGWWNSEEEVSGLASAIAEISDNQRKQES